MRLSGASEGRRPPSSGNSGGKPPTTPVRYATSSPTKRGSTLRITVKLRSIPPSSAS
ncbi:hypothetical protein [Methanoculleus chikugoensis]|uniref:hypothetical protein n=1 Tax=Methanoculleus chikugoensis TaxID=118126 RepID=UPI001FB3D5DC|nr:hypothetical protein [Methanoculleus chikugoensis]